jgi:hypothetical protein
MGYAFPLVGEDLMRGCLRWRGAFFLAPLIWLPGFGASRAPAGACGDGDTTRHAAHGFGPPVWTALGLVTGFMPAWWPRPTDRARRSGSPETPGAGRPSPEISRVVADSVPCPVVTVSVLWIGGFRCRFPPPRFGVFRHW